MALGIGIVIAIGVALFGRFVGLERERAFYTTVLVVVASYYALFAAMGGTARTIVLECSIIAVFVGVAVLGFKGNRWFIVAGLAGHGVMDVFHGGLISNPGVPVWWPQFCMGYDITAAAYLAWMILAERRAAGGNVAGVTAGGGSRADGG